MTETTLTPTERPRRFHFGLLLALLFTPRKAYEKISALNGNGWLTPLLVLTLTALLLVAASGYVKQQAAATGQMTLPPDYEWWTPDQQSQYQQVMQSTQGPVFTYVFPALGALARVWIGWLLMGALLHLALTLIGGRGNTAAAMVVVAWAGLPFALRDLVRFVYVLATRQLISGYGLAGFAPADSNTGSLFLSSLLALLDIYLIWHIVLLVIGARAAFKLSTGKALAGTLVSVLTLLALQVLLGFGLAKLQSLTIERPFFL